LVVVVVGHASAGSVSIVHEIGGLVRMKTEPEGETLALELEVRR
jgi:hypothetical protein